MKKTFFKIIIFLLLFFPISILASNINTSETNATILQDSKYVTDLTLNADSNVKSISFNLITTTYDAMPSFNVNSNYSLKQDVNNYTISFDEPISGKIKLGTITISVGKNSKIGIVGKTNLNSVILTLEDDTTVSLKSIGVTVTVTSDKEAETTNESNNTNLLRIESDIVSIALEDNKYEYTVEVDNSVKELDLKAIAEDSNATVLISTQNLDDANNKITITVTAEDKTTKEYTITVKKLEDKKDITTSDDDEEFTVDNSYKTPLVIIMIILLVILGFSIVFAKKKK